MNSIDILLGIMPEHHWRLMEEAASFAERGDWLTAETIRGRVGYDELAIQKSAR